MLDYHLFRSANDLAARHDGFEDVIKAYVQASELIFAVGVIALFLFFGPRLRRAAVAAGLTAGLALLVAHFLAAAVDRSRPFVDHPLAHNFLAFLVFGETLAAVQMAGAALVLTSVIVLRARRGAPALAA